MPIDPPAAPRAPDAPSVGAISCYRTVTPSALRAQASSIARVLSAIGGAAPADVMFWLMPDGRGFGYADSGALFEASSDGRLAASADDAEADARSALQRVDAGFGKDGTAAALKVAGVLPADLVLFNATPVYAPETSSVDHWLCRFVPRLRCRSSEAPCAVVDATIEVRVGRSRRLLGMAARWLPFDQEMLCSPIAPPDPRQLGWSAQSRERDGIESQDAAASDGSRIVYAPAQASDGEAWLLPCHVFDDDPLQRRYPAAQHRLNDGLEAAA